MKKSFFKIATVAMIVSISACSKVPAGHKGVIVNLYGSDKGVSEETVGVGRYYLGWNKELYLFPTFLQNYTWVESESITMQTSEGLSIKADVGITYEIKPENVSKVFQKYRSGIDEITHTYLHNMVRDAMNSVSSTMSVEDIYGLKKENFIKIVNETVKVEALSAGISVDKIYLIGSFMLPPTVIDSINTKIQATQNAIKVENEIATSRAEAQKRIVESESFAKKTLIEAEAKAKANEMISKSLSKELIQYNFVQKWDGQLPKVSGSQTIPLLNIKGLSND